MTRCAQAHAGRRAGSIHGSVDPMSEDSGATEESSCAHVDGCDRVRAASRLWYVHRDGRGWCPEHVPGYARDHVALYDAGRLVHAVPTEQDLRRRRAASYASSRRGEFDDVDLFADGPGGIRVLLWLAVVVTGLGLVPAVLFLVTTMVGWFSISGGNATHHWFAATVWMFALIPAGLLLAFVTATTFELFRTHRPGHSMLAGQWHMVLTLLALARPLSVIWQIGDTTYGSWR